MNTNAYDASGCTCVSNYQVTILDNRALIERLTNETRFAVDQLIRSTNSHELKTRIDTKRGALGSSVEKPK
jgi:hypothetical protein